MATEEPERRLREAICRVAAELMVALDEEDALTRLCALTVDEMACEASHIFLWKEEHQGFVGAAHVGELAEVWGLTQLLEVPLTALGSLPERLLRGEPVLVSWGDGENEGSPGVGAEELGLSPRLVSITARSGWQSCLYTGVRQNGRLIAFQTACRRDPSIAFTPHQIELARRLAHLTAFTVRYTSLAQALRRANRLQSEFVASMSHELRTPLNIVLGYNALLLEGEYGPLDETQRDILSRIALRARELADVITGTLDVSRLDGGQVPFDHRLVDIPALLSEVEVETRQLHTRPEVRLLWHQEEPLPSLRTDASKLRVVLRNLIANAAKFTEQGEINVLARASDDAFQFVVSDTGSGIDPELLPRIFEPFRKGGGIGLAGNPGAGLGLYIVQQVVERLGGEVLVESQPRRGSRFVVQLPLHRAPRK